MSDEDLTTSITPKVIGQAQRLPLVFEQNLGQASPGARFVGRSASGTILLTKNGVELIRAGSARRPLRLGFLKGASRGPKGEGFTGGFANYYLTRDRKSWLSGIPMFNKVRYGQVWPGVDVVFHGHDGEIEYDFEIEAGNKGPINIAIGVDGAERLEPEHDGSLLIVTGRERWRLQPPLAYQEKAGRREQVHASYRIMQKKIWLEVGAYDRAEKLVIDPVVEYAGTIGAGSTTSGIEKIAVDAAGNLIMTGFADSAFGFPVVNGQTGAGIYVAKLNAAGDSLLFSTFILPAGASAGLKDMKVDSSGNIYLTGTAGTNFPATSTALGTSGGYVMKLSSTGALVYSSIVGGGFPETMKVDSTDAVYVGGLADNTLQTVNAQQPNPPCNPCLTPFFAKIDPTGSAYIFSSYYFDPSGTTFSRIQSIDTDTSGNIYLYGQGPQSHVNAWQNGFGGIFISKLSPDGQTVLFSTDLGSGGSELPVGMSVGNDGTIFLVGTTPDNDYPYTIDALRHPEQPGGNIKMFASAINPALTGFTYSTYLTDANGGATFLGPNNHLYVAGALGGTLPLKGAVAGEVSKSGSTFYMELDATGQVLQASRFNGHLTPEVITAIAADSAGNIYLGGRIDNANEFPAPDPILVGHSFGGPVTGGNIGPFFAKISPVNAPQIVLTTIRPYLILHNSGSADLHISSMVFSGGRTWGNCGSVVPAATSCVVTVTDNNGGLAAGTLTITSDAQPAVQGFNVALLPGDQPGARVQDLLWFDQPSLLPPQLQATVPLHIWNVGTTDMVINLITINQPQTQTNDCGVGLAPGAGCTISVNVSSGGAFVQVFYDNGNSQVFDVFGTNATQNPLLSVPGIRFPIQIVGGVVIPRTVTITNTGNSDITVNTALTADPEFAIAGTTCGAVLSSHQSCVVGVKFVPVINGNKTGLLTIDGQNVQLSAGGEINSAVKVSPLGQDFFTGIVHQQGLTFPIKLTNTLSSAVPITGITFSISDYTETDDCAGQVPASGSCTLQVTFTPQALGARNGTVTVSFTGATTQVMPLTGIGQTPFLVSPANVNFTAALGSTSVEQGLSIGNRNSQPQGYTFTVTGDFAITQNPCANPLPPNGAPGSGCGPRLVYQPKPGGNGQGTFTVSYPGITEQDVVTLTGALTTVTASPLQLSFPTTQITTSSTLDVNLANSGSSPVGIVSLSTAAPYSETDSCQGQVPANGSCVLHVIFTPQTAPFPVTGTFNISLADGAQYSVALSGTGTGPVILINAFSTTFQDQVVGTTSNPATVSVFNNGDAPLNITGISISGDFAQTSDCVGSITNFCTITVTFSPKRTGLRQGTLVLTDNGLGSPQQITFSGVGNDFTVNAAGAGASATVAAGQTATYDLAFTAIGSFSGQLQVDCSGAPPLGTCHLSSPNVNVIGAVPVPLTVTVTTSPHTSASMGGSRHPLTGASILAGLLLGCFLCGAHLPARSRMLMVAAIVVALGIVSCGGGGGSQGNPPPPAQGGTPAGTYTITVSATDQTIHGPVVHQTNLTLVVR